MPLWTLKTNADLSAARRHRGVDGILRDKRGAVPILVVDDESFLPGRNLRTYGYRIDEVHDISDLNQVNEYPVVLCDIMGVGNFLDPQSQGKSIVLEIKNNYPANIVIAYSGASMKHAPAREASTIADRFVKKDVGIDEWTQVLDGAIEAALDPHATWKRVRRRLIDQELDTKEIIRLEDAYVRSILSNDPSMQRLSSLIAKGGSQAAKIIINNLINAAAFKLIVGIDVCAYFSAGAERWSLRDSHRKPSKGTAGYTWAYKYKAVC
jgi:CheY-like chemotaxis protein